MTLSGEVGLTALPSGAEDVIMRFDELDAASAVGIDAADVVISRPQVGTRA